MQHLLLGNIVSRKVAANHQFLSERIKPTRKLNRDFEKFRQNVLSHVIYPFLADILRRESDAKTRTSVIIDLYLLLVFMSIGNIKRLSPTPPTDAFVFAASSFEDYLERQLSVERQTIIEAVKWLTFKPVFVAEVKYDAFTADEISIYQHLDKLREACQQAKRKSQFLGSNWSFLSKKLGVANSVDEFFALRLTYFVFIDQVEGERCIETEIIWLQT